MYKMSLAKVANMFYPGRIFLSPGACVNGYCDVCEIPGYLAHGVALCSDCIDRVNAINAAIVLRYRNLAVDTLVRSYWPRYRQLERMVYSSISIGIRCGTCIASTNCSPYRYLGLQCGDCASYINGVLHHKYMCTLGAIMVIPRLFPRDLWPAVTRLIIY
jgi:hypothetical protein